MQNKFHKQFPRKIYHMSHFLEDGVHFERTAVMNKIHTHEVKKKIGNQEML